MSRKSNVIRREDSVPCTPVCRWRIMQAERYPGLCFLPCHRLTPNSTNVWRNGVPEKVSPTSVQHPTAKLDFAAPRPNERVSNVQQTTRLQCICCAHSLEAADKTPGGAGLRNRGRPVIFRAALQSEHSVARAVVATMRLLPSSVPTLYVPSQPSPTTAP